MLNLYALFHCNLAFSMVPARHFPLIVERCYWPVLRLAERGIPVAVEMPAWTLMEAERIDRAFTKRLGELWDEGRCEFIGSGYSQAIFPLIPAEVNRWNLEAGNRRYREILGRTPSVALVNEQTYSRGLVDIYKGAGYDTVIMDWNNCYQYNRYPKDYQYSPQRAVGFDSEVNLLWSNSIAFQKFQRAVHGELGEEEFLEYLFSHHADGGERSFVIYSNDAEVFDYRPGTGAVSNNEQERVFRLLDMIRADKRASIKTPSDLVAFFRGRRGAFNAIRLESAETPVVCKKQDKYNPVRWAAAGRDSVHINTECWKAYNNIRALIGRGDIAPETIDGFKEQLADLWGSDFRTNTIDEKFSYFHNRLGWLMSETGRLLAHDKKHILTGMFAENIDIFHDYDKPAAAHTGGSKPRRSGKPEAASVSIAGNVLKVETGAVTAEFLTNKGLAVKGIVFKGVSSEPLVGTLPHGYYDDMRLGADFFSGHLVQVSREGKKATDLKATRHDVKEGEGEVVIGAEIPLDIGTLWKRYSVSKSEAKVSVNYCLKVNGLFASSIRLGIFTFVPEGFNRDSLWYETINGGSAPERFRLKGKEVAHDEPVSQSVSASGCLGATGGWISVGDDQKTIRISSDRAQLYSVPMLRFKELEAENTFFLRLYHSIGEVDDTAWWVWRGYNEITFTLTAEKSGEGLY